MNKEKVERLWGYYTVLYDEPKVKVKELVVYPGKSLSMQKHMHRNEYWHVVRGAGKLKTKIKHVDKTEEFEQSLYENSSVYISLGLWHQLSNVGNENLHVVEIQYGNKCVEEDIERENDHK